MNAIETKIRTICDALNFDTGVFDEKNTDEIDVIQDLYLDSLSFVVFLNALEEHFDLNILDDQDYHYESGLQEIIAYLSHKTGVNYE